MKMALTIVGFLAAFPADPARADIHCHVPMADWHPRQDVVRIALDNGWTLGRIKIDDGCYQIDGLDAQGHRIKATINPGTLALIEIEITVPGEALDHDQDRDHHD